MRYSSDQTRKAFAKIPENIQDAIASIDTLKAIKEISQKYGLMLDVAEKLEEEVGYALLGLTKPTEFTATIKKELGIDEKKASDITVDINNKVFLPLKQNLVAGNTSSQSSGISTVVKQASEIKIAPPLKPPVEKLKEAPVLPHEEDYNMSRDAILSAIENPHKAEFTAEYVPHRSPESTDPKVYLENKQGLSALLEKTGVATAKKKRAKAVMMAIA